MNDIKRITVKGFKSIKSLVDFELNHLNVIVGANGSGKSNFVQLFEMIHAISLKGFQSFVYKNGDSKSFPFNGFKETPKIDVGLEFTSKLNSKGGSTFYNLALTPSPIGKLLINESCGYLAPNKSSYGPPDEESRLEETIELDKQGDTEKAIGYFVHDAISHWMIYHFHDSSLLAPMRTPELKDDNKYLRSDASNIAPFLLHLKNQFPGNYKSIVLAVQAVMPFFKDFTLETTKNALEENVKLTWSQKGTDYPMQSFHLSDGSIRFICLATALLQPNPPSIIIIDEPELGLHPAAIEILANLIEVASRSTQVIVATQSPLLLDKFNVEDIIIAKRDKGATLFERLDEEKLKLWLDDYSLGELWVKDIIQGGVTHEQDY